MLAGRLLADLDAFFATLPFGDRIQGPASTAEVEAAEKRVGLRLPDQLRSFYLWHNGALTCGFSLKKEPLPLRYAVESTELQRRWDAEERVKENPPLYDWRPTWFVWTNSDPDGPVAIECDVNSKHYGAVFCRNGPIEELVPVAASVEEVLSMWLTTYRVGYFEPNDMDAYRQLPQHVQQSILII